MTDWRAELIKDMINAMYKVENMQCSKLLVMARAALAVAEPVIREQADDALREENALLREALKPFANELKEQKVEVPHVTEDERFIYSYTLRVKHLRAAAAAIREGGKDEN